MRSLASLLGLTRARALPLGAAAAAVVLAIVLNVLGARHFRRADWTQAKLYTLSPATLATLHDLPDTIEVWVMLGGGDPLELSIKHLLVAYEAETSKLAVHVVDPDRDRAAVEDLRARFKIETGRTADGRIVTDAVIVVARGDQHWFISPSDLFDVSSDETRAKPREEQALTGAIRNVLGGAKVKLCFTAGHGEASLAEASEEGLGVLRDVLEKDNFDTASIDTTVPNAFEPFKGCSVVVIAAPRAPFTQEEEARLKTYLLEGGSLLAAVSPINAASATGMAPPGLAEALAPFGIGLDEDLVFEVDPRAVLPKTNNLRFYVTPKTHPVTAALVPASEGAREPPRVAVHLARSLHHVTREGAAAAADLLVTSDAAYGVHSIAGAAEWTDIPEKKAGDFGGPLAVAMAAERPKIGPTAAHGPRAVVVGAGSVLGQHNWRPTANGTALFTESAISWLASKPQVLDVPEKAEVSAGMHITEESRNDVRRYVLVFMPAAVILLGLAVGLWRRSTERRADARGRTPPPSTAAKPRAKPTKPKKRSNRR